MFQQRIIAGGEKEIFLFRHAQPEHDPGKIFPSKYASLSDLGRAQAFYTGRNLARKGIIPEIIICSPMERTYQTAEWLQTGYASVIAREIPLKTLDCLKEINIGSKPFVTDALGALLPVLDTILHFLHIRTPKIKHERVKDVINRVRGELLDELKNYTGTVFIISHQVTNPCIKSVLIKKSWGVFQTLRPHVGVYHFSQTEVGDWVMDKKYWGQRTVLPANIPRTFL